MKIIYKFRKMYAEWKKDNSIIFKWKWKRIDNSQLNRTHQLNKREKMMNIKKVANCTIHDWRPFRTSKCRRQDVVMWNALKDTWGTLANALRRKDKILANPPTQFIPMIIWHPLTTLVFKDRTEGRSYWGIIIIFWNIYDARIFDNVFVILLLSSSLPDAFTTPMKIKMKMKMENRKKSYNSEYEI